MSIPVPSKTVVRVVSTGEYDVNPGGCARCATE